MWLGTVHAGDGQVMRVNLYTEHIRFLQRNGVEMDIATYEFSDTHANVRLDWGRDRTLRIDGMYTDDNDFVPVSQKREAKVIYSANVRGAGARRLR